MDDELKELKTVLRSLVVSSPTQVDVRTLMRDYRNMVGKPIPLAKYGYREPVQFLKERFNDCFVFQGQPLNPVLTLIVPDTLKHIDNFVQKQKLSSTVKHKGKRRSIPVVNTSPPKNLICETFIMKKKEKPAINEEPKIETNHNKTYYSVKSPNENINTNNIQSPKDGICSISSLKIKEDKTSNVTENNVKSSHNGLCSKTALENFMKKRIPLYNSSQYLELETNHNEKDYTKEDTDSGRQTSSSNGSAKWTQVEELKTEIRNLLEDHPEGVWCTELIALYRERYGRELNFARFGYTSVLSLACVLEDALTIWRPEGSSDWKLLTRSPNLPPTSLSLPPLAPLQTMPSLRKSRDTVDPDDALPGIDFEADVFPEDCMHYLESIPQAELPEESIIEVQVGELYSPSHLWLIRLGEAYNIAMEDLMDEMNEYYRRGEGKDRTLARGAVRVGHYCSSCYEGDWHRSLIVRILDSDTVKVRHVDYGTVERCAVSGLRPLLRRWASLPQQAMRARMAGVRPPAAGRRWPRSSAAHLLLRLTDKRLVAQIVARSSDAVLEVLLVDTSTEEDVCINMELVRSGHADSRQDSCLGTSECYLYPTFLALEGGDTPNYAELHSYLRDGIDLEYVEDFRRHVPPCLPSPPTPSDHSDLPDFPTPLSTTCPLEHTSSNSTRSPLEYPVSPILLNNRIPIFPLSTEAAPTPPPTRPHTRPTPLFFKPQVSPNPNPTKPVPAKPDPPISVPTNTEPTNQVATSSIVTDPATSHPIPPSKDPAPIYRPQSTASSANEPQPNVTSQPHGVTLSASDCEVFCLLSRVDPNAAHRFMMEAIGRAANPPPPPTPHNPDAKEFHMVPAQTQTDQTVNTPLGEPRNSYTAPVNPAQAQSTHPVHSGQNGPYNGYTPINPLQHHTHPVYNGPQPNVPCNGYTPHPPMPVQTNHTNPVYNTTASGPYNKQVAPLAPAVMRFLESAHNIRPQHQNFRPPPGFENF